MQKILKKLNNIFEKHEVNSNTVAIILSIIILLGCFIFSYNYIKAKKLNAYTYMDNIFYKESTTSKTSDSNIQEVNEEEPTEEVKKQISYEYVGYLEIPKIGLKKGFVSKDSKYNDVEKNIYLVKEADYPFLEKGNLIIAGHSGSGWKAFFNDLYKLEVGNEINVTYNDVKYTYIIKDIYKQKKTGTIAIYRDYNKTTLTLVTCTNNDEENQTVYIAYRD